MRQKKESVLWMDEPVERPGGTRMSPESGTRDPSEKVTIDLMDSESEEEMAKNQLVGELFKKIRPGGSRG